MLQHFLVTICSFFAVYSIKHQQVVEVRNECLPVAHSGKLLLIGMEKGVDTYTTRDNASKPFITFPSGYVNSMQIYGNLLYLLHGTDETLFIKVYKLDGEFICSWEHEDLCDYINQFVVINNKVLVPSRVTRSIVGYTLKGERVGKDIDIREMIRSVTLICSTKRQHLIFSQQGLSQLICVSPTGDYLWQTRIRFTPYGITTDRLGMVLATYVSSYDRSGKDRRIDLCALDSTTGKL